MTTHADHRGAAGSPHLLPVLLGVAWATLGVTAGTLETLASGGGFGVDPALALTGLLWVPIAFAAVALARRVRWGEASVRRFLVVHGAGAVAAGAVLNLLFAAAAVGLGWSAPEDMIRTAAAPAVRWLHLNAGAYLAMVAVVHWVEGPGRGASPGSETQPTLRVERGSGGLRIPLPEILWLEADGDYVRVHTEGPTHLASRRMKELERELADAGFVRVHRSAMVNLRAVREARHRSHGDFEAVLSDGTVVRVSRTRRDALLEALEPVGE